VHSRDEVISEIKRGATFVTNGPFICLSSSESIDNNLISNAVHAPVPEGITAIIKSSYEFGSPVLLQVLYGKYGDQKESLLFSKNYKEKDYSVSTAIHVNITKDLSSGYLRAEVACRTEDGVMKFAATSPCYLLS
jgi:hypothetical protein